MAFSRRAILGGGMVGAVALAGGVLARAVQQEAFAPASGDGYAPWESWQAGPGEGAPGLVRGAILAANPHNTQPWRFRVSPSSIELHADPNRNIGAIDPFRREMHLGLGCALENLVLCAEAAGYRPTVRLAPAPPTYAARIDLKPGTAIASDLYRAIPRRHTHRGPYRPDVPVPQTVLDELAAMVSAISCPDASGRPRPEVTVRWITAAHERAAFSAQVLTATEAIIADAEQSRDSGKWFRLNAQEVHRHRDGLSLDTQALSPGLTFVIKLLPPVSQATADRSWLSLTRDTQLPSAPMFGVLAVRNRNDRVQRLLAGRAWQRMHLWATHRGLAMQPLSQIPERADRERQLGLPPVFGEAAKSLAGESGWEAIMPFRLGSPLRPALPSPRRDLSAVLLPA